MDGGPGIDKTVSRLLRRKAGRGEEVGQQATTSRAFFTLMEADSGGPPNRYEGEFSMVSIACRRVESFADSSCTKNSETEP
jgi:hypothetical protein